MNWIEIIDYRLGRKLFEVANETKTFYTIKGAMLNDTYEVGGEEYFKTFVEFVMKYAKEEWAVFRNLEQ